MIDKFVREQMGLEVRTDTSPRADSASSSARALASVFANAKKIFCRKPRTETRQFCAPTIYRVFENRDVMGIIAILVLYKYEFLVGVCFFDLEFSRFFRPRR